MPDKWRGVERNLKYFRRADHATQQNPHRQTASFYHGNAFVNNTIDRAPFMVAPASLSPVSLMASPSVITKPLPASSSVFKSTAVKVPVLLSKVHSTPTDMDAGGLARLYRTTPTTVPKLLTPSAAE